MIGCSSKKIVFGYMYIDTLVVDSRVNYIFLNDIFYIIIYNYVHSISILFVAVNKPLHISVYQCPQTVGARGHYVLV